MLDWINCMMEFGAFLGIYFCLSEDSYYSLNHYIIYFLLGSFASVYFVNATSPILALNILLYMIILLLSFGKRPLKNDFLLITCAVPFMLLIEFILHSLLPVTSLQTDLGNLVSNIVFLTIVSFLLRYIRRKNSSSWISNFFIRYFPVIFLFSISLIILGQVYLSRLSLVWSYLPGVITLIMFFSFLTVIFAITKYRQSEDHLRSHILEEQIQHSESFVLSMRTQLHDYKHHIQYLLDQIQSTPDLSTLQSQTAEYLIDLEHDRSFYDQLISIQQPVFRATLFGCFASCKKQGIPFQLITGDLLPSFPLKDYQLVEVIENLISNALEHNLSLPEGQRFILITLAVNGKTHYFSIENPSADMDLPLSELYRNGVSNKGGNHQGLGLGSIKKTLSDHNIQFSGSHNYDTESVRFELTYKEKYD